MTKAIPELNYLLHKVEHKYGRRLSTSTDFEALSVVIDREIGELVSASTLKRLWGYVSLKPTPRQSTLDILARFLGERSFQGFCKQLKDSPEYQSTFFSSKAVPSSCLKPGQTLEIGWNPDRLVYLKYIGNEEFYVNESCNSQLNKGDRFYVTAFMLGYPLYIPRILRDGEFTPSYIAGTVDGLSRLEVI